ncbi:hypothetical protein TNCV_822981 [Trichonephila clavipes]|nr:hypothetical protein TNCV_822981 [Trichonephila clavipes]
MPTTPTERAGLTPRNRREKKRKTPQSLSRPWQRETGWGKKREAFRSSKRISRTGLGERNVSLNRFEEP